MLLAWLFPLAVFFGTILFTTKNTKTSKHDLPIRWDYVLMFTIAAAVLTTLLVVLT